MWRTPVEPSDSLHQTSPSLPSCISGVLAKSCRELDARHGVDSSSGSQHTTESSLTETTVHWHSSILRNKWAMKARRVGWMASKVNCQSHLPFLLLKFKVFCWWERHRNINLPLFQHQSANANRVYLQQNYAMQLAHMFDLFGALLGVQMTHIAMRWYQSQTNRKLHNTLHCSVAWMPICVNFLHANPSLLHPKANKAFIMRKEGFWETGEYQRKEC